MECPFCHVGVAEGARLCPRCRVAVQRSGSGLEAVHPEIRVGERLYAVDLRVDRPVGLQQGDFELAAGKIRAAKVADGLLVTVGAGEAFTWSNSLSRLRDACVRVAVTMFDPSAIVYAIARHEVVGIAKSQYGFALSASRRAARVVRLVSGQKVNILTPLCDWKTIPAIAPVGAPNEVELRVQGPTLEGHVNGQRVVVLHDPVLGFGRAGIRFEAEVPVSPNPARVLWWGFDTCVVRA